MITLQKMSNRVLLQEKIILQQKCPNQVTNFMSPQPERGDSEHKESDTESKTDPFNDYKPEQTFIQLLADDFVFDEASKDDAYFPSQTTDLYEETTEDNHPTEDTNWEDSSRDSILTTTTFKPYFIPEDDEPKPPRCPFSPKALVASDPSKEHARTDDRPPETYFMQEPYFYGLDPFCLTRHHVFIPALPLMLPQWCFVPDTPDFLCPRYDLGFHIAFPHETHRDMYYRCTYGQAELRKCPNLHVWDDERKICTLVMDFSIFQMEHRPRHSLYDPEAAHYHCQQCRRNFLLPQDVDPSAQCSDRVLLACNTDGTLTVYECPGFYHHDRQIQLRWYADLERCDYPADGEGHVMATLRDGGAGGGGGDGDPK
uniref:Chitin-binding type-2 domain-containing protein n=1 Tax=Anopheles coluzzii TaxID=1518534 RepID=A0A8W7P6Q5_ANOCL